MKKTNPYLGTKARAVFYLITPVIISFSIIYIILFGSLYNTQQEMVSREFQSLVRKHSSSFESKINNAIEYLSLVASVLEYQVIDETADRESMQKMLFNVFEGHNEINGSSIYFEPNMFDGKDSDYIGTYYGTAISGRICFYYYRENGKTFYQTEAVGNDAEFSKPHYLYVKELNAPIYTDPDTFNIEGKDVFMFVIVYPIHGKNNEFIGAITADIHLGDFYEQLQADRIYETGYILIGNDRNIIIYSPIYDQIGKSRADLSINYPLPSHDDENMVFYSQSILNNKKTLVDLNTIVFPRFNSRFFISVTAPLSEINANGYRLMINVISISVVILFMIALILYYMISKMTKPFPEFIKTANEIARGDYSVRIKGDFQDEFTILKDTMNFMSERIEEHMLESKNSLRVLENILNGIDSYIYVTDPKTGELLFVNDRFKTLLNIKNDCIGKRCYNVLRNQEKRCAFCPCFELDKDPDKIITWEEHNTEQKLDFRHTDCYINWLGGVKVHLRCAIDITDIKIITAEKIKAETEAKELTSEKNRAEETSRMKSVFLASMSHEIRTPMHGIIGFTELALDDNITVKTRNYLSKIKTSAESLLMIINDILDVSKIEAGKMELEKIPFDISEVFKLCRMISSPKANEKGLTLFCYAEPSVGRMLLGDPTRLRQILLNLISNAIKFTNNGMVKILSAITGKTDSTVTMHFEVKDSGIGMTDEQLKKIFQPFTQADDSTTRKYGGTGLGLTITKNFIELMGSILEVESKIGLGSKFSFDITFDTVDTVAELSKISAAMNINEKPVFEGEILVCEDNELNQIVVKDHLYKVGLKTVIAENGKIAFDIVSNRIEKGEKPFDLIFMDIHMPEMDGLEATKKIKEKGITAPVIALTANIMAYDRESYFNAGMCDCLSKPFTSHDLWACLLKYLKPVNMISLELRTDNTEEEEHRIELISTFVKSNQSTIKDLNNAIEKDDIKLAHRLAHTLKGVSGIVGMDTLAEAAQNVEQMLFKGNVEFINEKIKILKKELDNAFNEFIPQINDYAAIHKNKNKDIIYDKERSLQLLDKLDSLLEADSFDSLSLVDDLSMIPGTGQLALQIENMKFKQARETLAAVRENLNSV